MSTLPVFMRAECYVRIAKLAVFQRMPKEFGPKAAGLEFLQIFLQYPLRLYDI